MVCGGTHPISYGLKQNRLTPFSHQQGGILPETTSLLSGVSSLLDHPTELGLAHLHNHESQFVKVSLSPSFTYICVYALSR